ncbi:MAG TPA: hypothetical protein VHF51_13145 [Solirubrobacteraceae bacterium]|nr:hypothetical protein [Solirubrobacteraceae bacterium]
MKLATPIYASADEVAAACWVLRGAVLADGRTVLLGAGRLRPEAMFGDVLHRDGSHYDAVAGTRAVVLRQPPLCRGALQRATSSSRISANASMRSVSWAIAVR